MPYYTYILESVKEGRFYFGQTQDIEQRLRDHNSGKSGYTRKFIPWKLFAYHVYDTRTEAMKVEKMLKNLHSRLKVLDFTRRYGFQFGSELKQDGLAV
jgi:putative endonuclease